MGANDNVLNYLLEQRWCNFKQDILSNNVTDTSFEGVNFDNGKKRLVIGKVEFNDKSVNDESPPSSFKCAFII